MNTLQTTPTKLIIVGDETTQLQSIPKHFSPVGGGNSYPVIRMEFHPAQPAQHSTCCDQAEEVTTGTHGI